MELLTPLGLIALVGVPAIIALYILRQRKPPRVVGSLWLWQQAHVEISRGRPWEKFRPSALLWLQLLAMIALALALSRPACVTVGNQGERAVLVLDGSASMAATDVSPSRWGQALERARQTVENTPDTTEIALLVSGRLTRVAEPFTRDRQRLLARLDALEEQGPDATSGDINEALLLALQLGGDDGPRDVVLFSDGAFDQRRLPPLGQLELSYVGVGQHSANLAITTFELRRAAGQRFGTSALCVVTNTGDLRLGGHLQISVEGRILEARRVELDPGAATTISVPISADEGRVTARLQPLETDDPQAKDWLATDNEAFAVIAPEEPVKVLLVGQSPLVERALAANARLEVTSTTPEGFTGSNEGADVVVFAGNFPKTIPSGRFLVLGLPADNPLAPHVGEPLANPVIASWDQSHPALLHLDLTQVRFGEVPRVKPLSALVPVAEFQGEGGPALLAGKTPSWRALVWTAPLLRSDLPLRVVFPIFLYNAIGWLSPGGEQDPGRTLASGTPLAIPARPEDTIEISSPKGAAALDHKVTDADTDGVYLHNDTGATGFYRAAVRRKGLNQGTLDFGVSLVDANESTITPRTRLETPRGGAIEGQGQVSHIEEQLSWLLYLLFGVMAVEWLLYLFRARRGRA